MDKGESDTFDDDIEGLDSSSHTKEQEDLSDSDRIFDCLVCSRREECAMHVKYRPASNTELVCQISDCRKSFSSFPAFSSHIYTHTGERPYACNICEKTFGDASTFRQHKLIHTGERPYICRVCNKAFNRNSIMRAHERAHTVPHPVNCSTCGKSFASKSILTRHIQSVHAGARPHTCDTCHKSFARLHHLVRHRNSQHHNQAHEHTDLPPIPLSLLPDNNGHGPGLGGSVGFTTGGLVLGPDGMMMGVSCSMPGNVEMFAPAFVYPYVPGFPTSLAPSVPGGLAGEATRLDLGLDPDSLTLMGMDSLVGPPH